MNKTWITRPHEFHEHPGDYSMCVCGVPADVHWEVDKERAS